jgi:Flp pilus assembly protein TadG
MKRNYKEKGQSLVEFSVSAMFILLLVSGIVDFGRAFFAYMAIRDAAQEGAAYGSAFPLNTAAIEKRVRENSQNPVPLHNTSLVMVEVDYTGGVCESPGNEISVTVEYTFTITAPFIGAIVGTQTFPLSTTVSDSILRPPC